MSEQIEGCQTIAHNAIVLKELNCSMAVTLGRVRNGSEFEEAYFLEKLKESANVLGFDLIEMG